MKVAGIEVIQSQPGQINLAIAKIKDNHDLCREVQARFSNIGGIQRVETDHRTGEVLVVYDKQEISTLRSLLALKDTFAYFFPEVNTLQLATWLSRSL